MAGGETFSPRSPPIALQTPNVIRRGSNQPVQYLSLNRAPHWEESAEGLVHRLYRDPKVDLVCVEMSLPLTLARMGPRSS